MTVRGLVPSGWDENPTARPKRLSLAARAFVGLCVAGYLAPFQLGVIPEVRDPFFLDGSREVLTSSFSRTLPIPDAALAYPTEVAPSFIGGADRWRAMPWTCVALGLVVATVAAVSVLLMVVRPIAVKAWCTLCLVSAFVSFTVVAPGMAELLASVQRLKRVRANGGSAWRALLGPKTREAEA